MFVKNGRFYLIRLENIANLVEFKVVLDSD
jgi:hypothetical protein